MNIVDELKQIGKEELERINFWNTKIDNASDFICVLKETFPEIKFNKAWYGWTIQAQLPYDFELINQVKDFCSRYGEVSGERQHIWETDKIAGYFFYVYVGELKDNIEFKCYSSTEGSTCKLTQIGEETKVVPIYEVNCGAEDWAE